MGQVERYRPPPSFVKEGDTRTTGYRERFGTDECWELDALSPAAIADLIRSEIQGLIDRRAWDAALVKERQGAELLADVAKNWTRVRKLLGRRRGGAA